MSEKIQATRNLFGVFGNRHMDHFFDDIDVAVSGRHHILALMAALTVPDMCGALDSVDGIASGSRYAAWFDQHLGHVYPSQFVTGQVCFALRCSLLHQGRMHHTKMPFSRVLFVHGGPMHCGLINVNGETGLQLDLIEFCQDITKAGRQWYASVKNTAQFCANYDAFMRLYPNGFLPFIEGLPVIT